MIDITDVIVRSIEEACDRYAQHRELRALSAVFFKSLTKSDKAFLKGWQACEFCGDAYSKATLQWIRMFARKSMPVLHRTMIMYGAVDGAHATEVARRNTTRIDRYSSFFLYSIPYYKIKSDRGESADTDSYCTQGRK